MRIAKKFDLIYYIIHIRIEYNNQVVMLKTVLTCTAAGLQSQMIIKTFIDRSKTIIFYIQHSCQQ